MCVRVCSLTTHFQGEGIKIWRALRVKLWMNVFIKNICTCLDSIVNVYKVVGRYVYAAVQTPKYPTNVRMEKLKNAVKTINEQEFILYLLLIYVFYMGAWPVCKHSAVILGELPW